MTMFPKHGDQNGSDRWDRAAMAWVPADEWQRRQWDREDRAFARKSNQGELCAPMIISDCQGGVRGLQSQADGKHYDSKSEMRKHYRRDGLIEIGNDVPEKRICGDGWKDPKAREKRMDAIGRAFNRVGLPTT